MLDRHSVMREGPIAGAIGATTVAVWFFVLDWAMGQPLYTPLTLGSALFSVLNVDGSVSEAVKILGYTVFHYAAFSLVGIVAVALIHGSRKEPGILAGVLILFVAIELGFYFLASLLSQASLLGAIAWYLILAGNLLAATSMGAYLVRGHPMLVSDLEHALSGKPM